LGTFVMSVFQDNDPGYLLDAYQRTGLLWQPGDIGLTRDEFTRTLTTLNWYQKNFGRRYSILNQKAIDQAFINQILDRLEF
jgi:hypothetical protein